MKIFVCKKIKPLFWILILAVFLIFILKNPIERIFYPLKYEQDVLKWSNEFDVDPSLVFAVIKTESGFRKDVVSHKDAHGLMQITFDTFEWAKLKMGADESFEDIFIPSVNIKYGSFILSYLLKEFEDEKVALAAYNAGRGNANRWLKDENFSKDGKTLHNIPFKETREYVPKVLDSKQAYKKLYPQKFIG